MEKLELENPPLLVRVQGKIVQLPHEVSVSLIRNRLAIPVAEFSVLPEIVVDEDDIENAGLQFTG